MKIYEQIQTERKEQDKKWGGAKHDDEHTANDWLAQITKQLGKCVTEPGINPAHYKYQMVRVAALAVAANEWVDRNS